GEAVPFPHVIRFRCTTSSFLGEAARALISRLTEEKNNAIQQTSRLRQELELLKREGNKNRGGVSFIIVILIGLLGIIMGYLMK
ncbi:vesicle-associated protein 1-2-like, partial [Trifolium pratense]